MAMRERISDLWWEMSIKHIAMELDVPAQTILSSARVMGLPSRAIAAPPPERERDASGDGTSP